MKRETWKWALQLLISILTNHDGSNLVHGVKEEEWDCQIWWSHFLAADGLLQIIAINYFLHIIVG